MPKARSGRSAADALIDEAFCGEAAPGRTGCGRRAAAASAGAVLIAAKSGLRNCAHSVTSTSASAPSPGVFGAGAELEGQRVRRRSSRLLRIAIGSKAWTLAPPSAQIASISTRLGASRMSSVLGLNARPQIAMVLPLSDRPECDCEAIEQHATSGARSRPRPLEGLQAPWPCFGGGAHQGLHVLGEAGTAVAAARVEEMSSRCAYPSRCRRGPARYRRPTDSARLRQFVHEGNARRQHGVGGVLGQLGRSHVHDIRRSRLRLYGA